MMCERAKKLEKLKKREVEAHKSYLPTCRVSLQLPKVPAKYPMFQENLMNKRIIWLYAEWIGHHDTTPIIF